MGFFSSLTLEQKPKQLLVPACGTCGLYKLCKSPKFPVYGEGRLGILIVAESPGPEEDDTGFQLSGNVSQYLVEGLAKFDVDIKKDCWLTYSAICRVHDNGEQRNPTSNEIDYCRPNLMNVIKELQPNVIICLGNSALESVLGNIWRDKQGYTIARWNGWQIPCQALNAWICPTWNPAYVLREHNPVLQMFWERHVKKAVSKKRKPWKTVPDWEKKIDVILDDKEAAERIMLMTECSNGKPLAWDIETSTKKPDGNYAQIFSCSISDGDRSISYPWCGRAIEATKSFIKSKIPKIGFNLKFETRWSISQLNIRPKNWIWDGMVNAHVLDCRQGITSLGFQSFIRLGIGKTEGVSEFLTSNGSNTLNRIKQVDLRLVLKYGGLDSLLEWKVSASQMKEAGIEL